MSPQLAVEVRPAVAPDGRTLVLCQFPGAYLLVSPTSARELATRLTLVAEEVEAMADGQE